METIKNNLPRFLKIFVPIVIGTMILSYFFNNGILTVTSNAIFIKNFDGFENLKNWNQFKEEYTGLKPEESLNSISMKLSFNSIFEEVLYPKSVTGIHIEIDTTDSDKFLQKRSFLIILLDQNERIRGKLYTRYESSDCFLKGTTTEFIFWFKFPDDMRGEKYSVIVELLGLHDYYTPVSWGSLTDEVKWKYDDVYGQLPSRNNLDFLAYRRNETKVAPSSSIINPLSLAFEASLFISSSTGLLSFYKELKNHQHENRVLIREILLFLILICIVILVLVLLVGLGL